MASLGDFQTGLAPRNIEWEASQCLPDYSTWTANGTSNSLCDSPLSTYSDSSLSQSSTPPPSAFSQPLPRPSQSRKKAPGHISRPPNAFLLFRSDLWAREKLKPNPVERDHRYISRIAGHCWRNLDAAAKQKYHDRSLQLRELHQLQNPEYRYTPAARKARSAKKSNTTVEVNERCRRLASTIMPTTPPLDTLPTTYQDPYSAALVLQRSCSQDEKPLNPTGHMDCPASKPPICISTPPYSNNGVLHFDCSEYSFGLEAVLPNRPFDDECSHLPPLPNLDYDPVELKEWYSLFQSEYHSTAVSEPEATSCSMSDPWTTAAPQAVLQHPMGIHNSPHQYHAVSSSNQY